MELKTAKTEPALGLYPNMTDMAYFALPHLSHSDLKQYVTGKAVGDTRTLLIGTALHTLMLQGVKAYEDQFYEHPIDFPLNTKEGKDKLYELEAEHRKRLLRPSEYRVVGNCAKSLWSDAKIKNAISATGPNELCVISKLSGYETICKCMIDMRRRSCLADIKTTGYRNASEFKDAIVKFGYASQAAFYVDLYASVTGEYLPWFFICVSKDTFEAWQMPITNEQLAFGRRWYQDVLTLYERHARHEH